MENIDGKFKTRGEVMNSKNAHKIRPSGRHLLTIGRDLIQDNLAAIVELIKNAYDADSEDVILTFKSDEERNSIQIVVEDHGHGMSQDDVINKWMVPSTDYKVKNRKSPNGRIMQGRKGIGKYATSILGNKLTLETIDKKGEKTSLFIDWDNFEKTEYLEDVDIIVDSIETNEISGTKLTINGGREDLIFWNENQFRKLKFELKKLIPPEQPETYDSNFRIILEYVNFYKDKRMNTTEEMAPYPILELYDYRISGKIDKSGCATLIYSNQKIKNTVCETIEKNYGPTLCGELSIDIRVYDREPEAIEQLIARGLKDEQSGDYVSKLQAKQLLNEVNGIGVYRNGFRIRPIGDSDFDWLKLNQQRIQNPTLKIGSNQVVGYIHIESEEESSLEEKSARDGLKDNLAYERLKAITCDVISELEKMRYIYRRQIGSVSPVKKLEKQFDKLYDDTKLNNQVSNSLFKAGISKETVEEITQIITKDHEAKNNALEEVKKAVAIYQGQATLGKIIDIILHEGRRPLNCLKNEIPDLIYYSEKFKKMTEEKYLNKIVGISSDLENSAKIFSNLFGKLDPLAAKKRETKKVFNLSVVLNNVVRIFQNELNKENILVNINCDDYQEIDGWEQDMYTVFANLIDNSIFWITNSQKTTRTIDIIITSENNKAIQIDYKDSGLGIEKQLLESQVIFEPKFTTKSGGTGLGLAIAGEAATRNNFELKAEEYEDGAYFRLSYKQEENEE